MILGFTDQKCLCGSQISISRRQNTKKKRLLTCREIQSQPRFHNVSRHLNLQATATLTTSLSSELPITDRPTAASVCTLSNPSQAIMRNVRIWLSTFSRRGEKRRRPGVNSRQLLLRLGAEGLLKCDCLPEDLLWILKLFIISWQRRWAAGRVNKS